MYVSTVCVSGTSLDVLLLFTVKSIQPYSWNYLFSTRSKPNFTQYLIHLYSLSTCYSFALRGFFMWSDFCFILQCAQSFLPWLLKAISQIPFLSQTKLILWIPYIPNTVLDTTVCNTTIKVKFYWKQTQEILKEKIQMVLLGCDHTLRDFLCFAQFISQ